MGKLIRCANNEISKGVIHRACEIDFFHILYRASCATPDTVSKLSIFGKTMLQKALWRGYDGPAAPPMGGINGSATGSLS
jgi:hypothetical protein